jgi:WD40 repeat protein
LTACRDSIARLWNWKTGELVRAFAHKDEVFHAIYSPDEKWIITGSRDVSARIWDPTTGMPVTPPLELYQWCHRIEVTSDGRNCVVSGNRITLINIAKLLGIDSQPLSRSDLRNLSEILAGRRVQEGNIVNLTSREWYDRWQSLQGRDVIERLHQR